MKDYSGGNGLMLIIGGPLVVFGALALWGLYEVAKHIF